MHFNRTHAGGDSLNMLLSNVAAWGLTQVLHSINTQLESDRKQYSMETTLKSFRARRIFALCNSVHDVLLQAQWSVSVLGSWLLYHHRQSGQNSVILVRKELYYMLVKPYMSSNASFDFFFLIQELEA